jgi:HEPN domain-containing protein
MTPLTRQWLRKADDDKRMASAASRMRPPLHDMVCYHCQQAVEKYVKALINELALPIPKIHDLERLLAVLAPHDGTVLVLRPAIDGLIEYAVEYRYPGLRATKRQATVALTKMEQVRTHIRRRLGLRYRQ